MATEFCPRCGYARTGSFRFCRSCGLDFDLLPGQPGGQPEPKPRAAPTTVDPATESTASLVEVATPRVSSQSLSRKKLSLLIGGSTAAVFALLFWAGVFSTASVAFSPNTLRCDGTSRAWTLRLPTTVESITTEMREGGANGPIVASDTENVSILDAYKVGPGEWRIETTTYDAWECRQSPGRYAMVIRDATSGQILTSTDFSIAH